MSEIVPKVQEETLLRQALALPASEREAFLEGACGEDQALRQRIEERLKAEAAAGSVGATCESPTVRAGTVADKPTKHLARQPKPAEATPASDSDTSLHGRFLPGTKVADRYRIVSLAGKGGMGEVYRADDLKLGHPVALKFLPRDLPEGSRRLQYLLNEVRLARQVSHPNVCRVYDVGEVEGQHFLSMEYIDGEDLKGLLRRIGRLPKEKATGIAQQLCAGLAAAHDKGVLHGDLKPANIMIDGRGQARITDFGLARLAAGPSSPGLVAGTPAYMAPEQLAGGQTTIQSDLYALGLILYEMFTGQHVQRGDLTPERLPVGDDSSPTPPSNLVADMDPVVERVILRCLERQPGQRPKSARAVAAGLPGGDPLAAAVAAGETPSPEMVAAAGGEGVIHPRVGLACLAGIAVGLAIVCWLAQRMYLVNRVGLQKHPEALAAEAQRMLEKLGYREKPADRAFGFTYEGDDPDLCFWYRQSPRPLIVEEFWGYFRLLSYGRVTEFNPRWVVPGESGVGLKPDGKLVWFRAVPPSRPDKPELAVKFDGSEWFPEEFTGFDLKTLEKVEGKELRPPDAYDQLQVWKGRRPKTGERFFIEAAAYSGKPVYFEVFSRAEFGRGLSGAALLPQSLRAALAGVATGLGITEVLYYLLTVGAGLLAWRNFRLGRSDRKRAFRLAFWLFSCGVLTWLSLGHQVTGPSFDLGVAQAVLPAAQLWLYYTALEPFVRRWWPQTLVSWTRLLDGRLRDPLVGRDILVGILLAVATLIPGELQVLVGSWLGLSPLPPWLSVEATLGGPSALVGYILSEHVGVIWYAALVLLFLVLVRLVLRKTLFVWCVCLPVGTILHVVVLGAHPVIGWLVWGLTWALYLWAIPRFGFLAAVAWLFTGNLLAGVPLTTDFSAWYASHGLAVIGIVAALALFGSYTATGSRRLFQDDLAARG